MTATMNQQHQETEGQLPLRDRVAFVTGGTRGIGEAIGHALAEQGASIAAGYWRSDEPAKKFLAAMTEEYPGRRTTLHEGNIGHADDCRRVRRGCPGRGGTRGRGPGVFGNVIHTEARDMYLGRVAAINGGLPGQHGRADGEPAVRQRAAGHHLRGPGHHAR